jgi:hypothetical protein
MEAQLKIQGTYSIKDLDFNVACKRNKVKAKLCAKSGRNSGHL